MNPDAVCLAIEHLLRERLVVLGGTAVWLERRHRLPLPAPLADLGARVYDGGELPVGEVLVEHRGARRLGVGHEPGNAGPQYPPLGRGDAQRVRDGLDGAHREGGAAHDGGVELHRNDHHAVASGGEVRVEGEALHGRAAVDDADVVVLRAVVQREAQALLAQKQLVLVDELYRGGHDGEVLRPRLESRALDGLVSVEKPHGSAALPRSALVEPEEIGRRRLRVQVDQQGPQPPSGVYGREVDRRGGLADPALVVRYRDGAHAHQPPSHPRGPPPEVEGAASPSVVVYRVYTKTVR